MTETLSKILKISSVVLCILSFVSVFFIPIISIKVVRNVQQPDIYNEYAMTIFRFIGIIGEKGFDTDSVVQIRVYLMILTGVLLLCAVVQIILALSSRRWLRITCYVFVFASLIYVLTIVLEMNFVVVEDINNNPLFYAESGVENWIISIAAVILVIIDTLILCIDRTDLDDLTRTLTVNSRIRYEHMYAPSVSPSPVMQPQTQIPPVQILFISGEHSGMKVNLNDGESVTIGRDPAKCNIVVSSKSISRLHCTISFDRIENKYLLHDTSSNGIFLPDGTMLLKGYRHLVPRGTTLILDREKNTILLT